MDRTTDQRRSERRECRIALHLGVALSDGTTADVEAETLVVNRHGAKIYSKVPLLAGTPITIRVAGHEESVKGVIAWTAKSIPGIFGIEITSGEAPWE
jgi:hypothetical protein